MSTQDFLSTSSTKIWQKWSIAFKIIPLILVVTVLKFLAHYFNLEIMELNALFTSLVAGTIFLIGFLISGVLSDYKESEKIPAELTASMKTLLDDTYTIYKTKNSESALSFIQYQKQFLVSLMDWFYKKETTKSLLKKISGMNEFIVDFDKQGVQAGYIVKLKNEQVNLRKMILRIDTIRETDFVGPAYAILQAMGILVGIGLIIIKINPFYAGLFFTLLVTFLITYMFFLIRDLDDPFDYSTNGESGTEVTLQPIHDYEKDINYQWSSQ